MHYMVLFHFPVHSTPLKELNNFYLNSGSLKHAGKPTPQPKILYVQTRNGGKMMWSLTLHPRYLEDPWVEHQHKQSYVISYIM